MNDSDKAILQRCHQDLANDTIVDEDLLGRLFQEGVFDQSLIAIIRSSTDRIQKLLELLPKRGPLAMNKFIKVLHKNHDWLAKMLIQAREAECQQQKGPRNSNSNCSNHVKRLSISKSAPVTLPIDKDIRQIVGTFIHKLFGQSKKISEKDKRKLEHFLTEQIQGERNRYQRLLSPYRELSDLSRDGTPDDVVTKSEVTEKLYSIHTKLEPFMLREGFDGHPDVECVGRDDDGHPDYRSPRKRLERQVPKHFPEDMDFDIIHKEINFVLDQIESLRKDINVCLQKFESDDRFSFSLPQLVDRVINNCKALEEESLQNRQHTTSLLDKMDEQSDTITSLEQERTELRKQIQAIFLDMSKMRQDKSEMKSNIETLERRLAVLKQQQQQDRKGNLQCGTERTFIKTSPRKGGGGDSRTGGGGGDASSSVTPIQSPRKGSKSKQSSREGGGGGADKRGEARSDGQYLYTSCHRSGKTYMNYARDGVTTNLNRYGQSVIRKIQKARINSDRSRH